jgi:hypothetical protein
MHGPAPTDRYFGIAVLELEAEMRAAAQGESMTNNNHRSAQAGDCQLGGAQNYLSTTFWANKSPEQEELERLRRKEEIESLENRWRLICQSARCPAELRKTAAASTVHRNR